MKKTLNSFQSCRCLAGISLGLLLSAAATNAQLMFKANFNGTNNGTGGASDMVAFGGTGAIIADGTNIVAFVTNAVPFATGTHNYLEVQRLTTNSTGDVTYPTAAFTFSDPSNSWTAWQGPDLVDPDASGNTYANLHGAFDGFFRINSAGTATDATSVRMIDMTTWSGGGENGLRMQLLGTTDGYLNLWLMNPGYTNNALPYAIQNVTLNSGQGVANFGGGDNVIINSGPLNTPANRLSPGKVWHVAVSINTDTNTGITTMNIYEASGVGALDPAANLLSSVSFNIISSNLLVAADSSPTNVAFVNQPWHFSPGWADTGPFNVDYASPRLYASTPTNFPALEGYVPPAPGLVFEADFNGNGTGNGNGNSATTNIVTTGGTATLGTVNNGGTVMVTNVNPFTPGSGQYLTSTQTPTTSGRPTICTFTPATAANGLNAMYAGVINGFTAIKGGFDLVVRPDVMGPSSVWYRPIDSDNRGNGGLRLIIAGTSLGTNLTFQLVCNSSVFSNIITTQGPADPGVVGSQNFPGPVATFTCVTSGRGPTGFQPGQVRHLGFTFNTDTNGLVTWRFFGSTNTGAIDTSATNNLIGSCTFYVAGTVTNRLFAPGNWALQENAEGANNTASYDTVRLYSADPGTFLALPGVPTTVALTSSQNPSALTSNVTFTATVQTNSVVVGSATGTVIFEANGVAFSTNSVASGVATSPAVSTLPVGTITITALYSGDGNYQASSSTLSQVVTNLAPAGVPGFSLPPTISGGNISLTWTNGGMLLWTTNLAGPWTTNLSATSPYSEPVLPVGNRFYRLQQ